MVAVSALAVADAPDVALYLTFFRPIVNAEVVSSGLAITLVPALATTLFIFIALIFVHCKQLLIVNLDRILNSE